LQDKFTSEYGGLIQRRSLELH